MRRFLLFAIFYHLSISALYAQSTPYLIPQTVFVGDAATLVYPLGGLYTGDANITLGKNSLPGNSDIVITHAEIDAKNKLLLIRFVAYQTGVLLLPPFSIGNLFFENLEVNISSVLKNENSDGTTLMLSPPSPPMAAPGTFWFFVITLLVSIFVLFTLLVFSANHHALANDLFTKIKRRLLYTRMIRNLQKLRASLYRVTTAHLSVLPLLSSEMRAFISLYTNINCRSFTPGDFQNEFPNVVYDNNTLYTFFSDCDKLRFSGSIPPAASVLALLNDALQIVENIRIAMKKDDKEVGTN